MSLESFNSEEITGEETDRVDESTMDRLSFSENKEPRGDKSISKQLLETDLASTDASWGFPCELNGQLYLMFLKLFLPRELKV